MPGAIALEVEGCVETDKRARVLRVPRLRAALCGLFVTLACAATAGAQSGRRAPRAPQPGTAPAPVIELPHPEPARQKRVLPNVSLLVAGHIEKKSDSAQTIYNKFVARLGASMRVTSLDLVKHEEAERRARSEAENYVIWLELDRDAYQGGRVIFNSPDYVIRYSILAPRTAEVKAKGKVYYHAINGPRARRGAEAVVKITPEDAGEAAADMVLDLLAFIAAQRGR